MIEITFARPHPKQLEIIDSKARYKVLMCGRRFGKTTVSQILALDKFLNGKEIAIVTPEHRGGQKFARDILKKIPSSEHQGLQFTFNKSDYRMTNKFGGAIDFYSAVNIGNIRGNAYHYIIIDEAAKIGDLETAWNEDISGCLVDYEGEALIISTPRGRDYFNALYEMGLDESPKNEFKSWRYTTYDNPHIKRSEINKIQRRLSKAQFNQEYMALPMVNAENPFERIEENTIKTLFDTPTVVFGIDLATSKDWSVVTGLDIDGNMTYFHRFRKSWPETHIELMKLPKNILKVIDNTGVGSGVVSRLAEEMPNVRPFNFNKESKLKLMWQLIGDIANDKLKFNEATAKELGSFERKKNATTGNLRFEAIRGHHDDCVMALAMANYYRIEAYGVTQWRPELI